MELGAAQQLSEGRRCGCRAVPPLSLSTHGVLARRRRALLLRPHLKRLVRHGHHLSKGSGADPDSFFDDFEVYRSRIKGAKFFDRKQIRGREASGSSQIFPEPSQSGGVRVWGMRVAAMGRGNGSKLSKKPSYSFVRVIQGGRRFFQRRFNPLASDWWKRRGCGATFSRTPTSGPHVHRRRDNSHRCRRGTHRRRVISGSIAQAMTISIFVTCHRIWFGFLG